MSVEITFDNLWTYRNAQPKTSVPLGMLDSREYTHIHGEFQIIINGEYVPKLGFNKNKEVCIGYWIKGLAETIRAFRSKEHEFTIYGWEQGIPSFRFEKRGKQVFLSLVYLPEEHRSKKKENQPVYEFQLAELYEAFDVFRLRFLSELEIHAPAVIDKWLEMFEIGNFSYDEKS